MPESNTLKNKRIVKNTVFMYIRMLVFLAVSLFTARIVLNVLGFIDYGIYNLVGSILVFFTFINNGLNTATKRYLISEIDTASTVRTNHIFNSCLHAHIIIGIIILVLAETIGLWVINSILNIPSDRIHAANLVYQLSVITAILNIIQSPFGVLLLAHENMKIYAYFSIFEVSLKLLLIFLIDYIPGDKFIIYGWLLFGVSLVNMIIYRIYSFNQYTECRKINIQIDKPLLKNIFSFTGWSLFGQGAVVASNQGVSVLINVYYGVIVNAAMGISNTVTNTVQGFVTNFQTAFNPQIIKSYAQNDTNYLMSLMIRSAKLSSFLILLFFIPIIFELQNVLKLWLGKYPEYTLQFCILVLIANFFEAFAAPLWMMIYSQSNIKNYQLITSIVYLQTFTIAWLLLIIGCPPYTVITARIAVFVILIFIRLRYVKKFFKGFQTIKWLKSVIGNALIIGTLSALITFLIKNIIYRYIDGIFATLSVCFSSVVITGTLIYTFGLSLNEKLSIKSMVLNKIK